MRVLYLVLDARVGGHARSAASIGCAMARHGHQVFFALPQDNLINVSAQAEFTPVLVPGNCRNPLVDYRTIPKLLMFIRQNAIELIHSFDLHSHIAGYLLGRMLRLPVISTVCGGSIKYHYPYTRPVIVFSRELKETMTKRFRFKANEIIVEPARMDITRITPMERTQLCAELGVEAPPYLLGMVARLSLVLELNIAAALRGIDVLASKRQDFVFAVVGAVQDRCVAERIQALITTINTRHGRVVCLLNQSCSNRAREFIASVDVLLGYGRVCFEGMIAGRPTVVVGVRGLGGIITPDCDMDTISGCNFSGRNAGAEDPDALAVSLDSLLNDERKRGDAARFGRGWVESIMDVNKAVYTYERVYQGASMAQVWDPIYHVLGGYGVLLGGKFKDLVHRIHRRIGK